MRGSLRKRGNPGSWEYRLELGLQPAQRCTECGKVRWVERRPLDACPCGGALGDVERRRERTCGGFKTQKAAQAALDAAKLAVVQGDFVEPSKLTVSAYLTKHWLPTIKDTVRPSTYVSYSTHVERHIVPRLGTVRLQKLNGQTVSDLYRYLQHGEGGKRGLSPQGVRHTHAVLHRALQYAVKQHYLAHNPATGAELPQVRATDVHEMKTWSADEVKAFLSTTRDDRLSPLWRVIVSCGLRRGEACGLRWSDVDLAAGRITIARARVTSGYKVSEQFPKTKKGRRVLPIGPDTVAALQTQAARQADDAAAWGDAWYDSGFVFTTEDGQPVHPDRVSKIFEKAVAGAPVPRIRLHDLRHTCATLLLRAGVHPRIVQEMLGHANIGITLDTYSHVDEGMKRQATDAITALLGSTA